MHNDQNDLETKLLMIQSMKRRNVCFFHSVFGDVDLGIHCLLCDGLRWRKKKEKEKELPMNCQLLSPARKKGKEEEERGGKEKKKKGRERYDVRHSTANVLMAVSRHTSISLPLGVRTLSLTGIWDNGMPRNSVNANEDSLRVACYWGSALEVLSNRMDKIT